MNLFVNLLILTLLTLLTLAQRPLIRTSPGVSPKKTQVGQKVMCTADSLMIYQDCLICVCPRPHRVARCFRKSCDLRTKPSGQCPPTWLKLDDNKLCPGTPVGQCRTDNDCPDKAICCFDFCKGNQCVNAAGLDTGTGTVTHRGMGYA